ncbi:MAG: RNA-directed DNA polymerase [Bacteroidales bacterium]|nr:RNA-directed DNA polymerase [Bacteroidales bacterium]
MRRKKFKLRYKKERVVFSDVLPYELPFIFTNRYFYRFLVKNEITIDGSEVLHWKEGIHKGALAILALLSQHEGKQLKGKTEIELKKRLVTIPFNYAIKHKETSNRRLSIVHPLNQIQIVDFYNQYKNTLLYMCGKSHFSIRYPNKVACYFYYKDRLHSILIGKKSDKLEIYFSEYENMKTFFSYKKYPNIYKFYEDYRYQRAEKKFKHLLKFDIQGCFDNIYTHSIAWAVNGGMNAYKDHFEGKDDSFASRWDEIMQHLNYNETNGIVIGPEFSRIFAETILQHIDLKAEAELKKAGFINKVDYECYRYVDDFFLFHNDPDLKDKALRIFDDILREFKMTISHEKTIPFERPFITDITRAKNLIDILIQDSFSFSTTEKEVEKEDDDDRDEYDADDEEVTINEENLKKTLAKEPHFHLKATHFNKKYKDILSSTNVAPKDVANYTLAIANIHLPRLLKKYDKIFKALKKGLDDSELEAYHNDCTQRIAQLETRLSDYLLELVDAVFFIFSENDRINTTLKLSQVLNEIIIYLDNDYKISKEKTIKRFTDKTRALVFKKIRDEICLVMQRTPMNPDTQLETLYLLPVFRQMRAKYRLTSVEIERYLGLKRKEDGSLSEFPKLNAIAIIILLYYMGSSNEYDKLKEALKVEINRKFEEMPNVRKHRSAEMAILALDLAACPYLGVHSKSYKQNILRSMGLSIADADAIAEYMKTQKYMFTKWTGVNVTKELNAKISQEVYS